MKAFIELNRDPRNGEGVVWVDVEAITAVSTDDGASWVETSSGGGYYVLETPTLILEKMGEAYKHLDVGV